MDSFADETDAVTEQSELEVQPFSESPKDPSVNSPIKESPKPPEAINLKADRQSFDARRGVFVAEGNVQAELRGGLLQADRIEFDTNFNTLYARGSVRLRRGSQYFQASTFRYSLIQNSGELKDVYGVLELDELSAGFQSSPKAVEPPSKQTLPVLESSGLGFPTALDMELGGRTARQITVATKLSRSGSSKASELLANQGRSIAPIRTPWDQTTTETAT